jgi:hypothetical protein
MYSLSREFSKAGNLFIISIWYCLLTSMSFNFLRLNIFPSHFCGARLLTAYILLTFTTTRKGSVSQPAPLNHRTSSMLECHFLSLNKWSSWLWVFQLGEVQVYFCMFRCGNIVLLTTRFFDVVKFTILTPLSLLSWCNSHSQMSIWKYSLSPHLH